MAPSSCDGRLGIALLQIPHRLARLRIGEAAEVKHEDGVASIPEPPRHAQQVRLTVVVRVAENQNTPARSSNAALWDEPARQGDAVLFGIMQVTNLSSES